MAFKKRYKSRTRTKPGSPPSLRGGGGGGGGKNRARGREGGRGTERRGKTLIILRQTHRGCAHRYMRDVEHDAVKERKKEKVRWYYLGRGQGRERERGGERERIVRVPNIAPELGSLAKTAPLWRLWKWNCNRKREFTAQEIHPPPPPSGSASGTSAASFATGHTVDASYRALSFSFFFSSLLDRSTFCFERHGQDLSFASMVLCGRFFDKSFL